MTIKIIEPSSQLEPTPARLQAAHNLLEECAGIVEGSEVLFVNEVGKGVDPLVVLFLEDQARAIGAKVCSIWPSRAESPEAIPENVMTAIESSPITIFNHQIGPLLRLRPAKGLGIRVLNYAATLPVLDSEFARVPNGLWLEVMDRLGARINSAKTWSVTCPLGTEISGPMPPPQNNANPTGFSLRSFPMDTHSPIPLNSASGKIVFKWFVTSSMHDLGTEGITLEAPLTATITNGRIVSWAGPNHVVEQATSFLAEIGTRFGKDPCVVNSWHAGVNPQACVAFDATQSLEQWMLLAHGNPRILHFHVVGEKIPGEISATVVDATVMLDGEVVWDRGRLRIFDAEDYRALMIRWPGSERAFEQAANIGV